MVAFDPQGSTAALNAAGYMDTPAGRASYTTDTGATSYPSASSVNFDSNGRIIPNNPISTSSSKSSAPASDGGLQALLNALASGNKAAADEAAKEFAQTFGLDQQKFQESVKEYNQNFGLAAAGVTGTYNGQPTLAAQNQAQQNALAQANLTGYYVPPSFTSPSEQTTSASSSSGASGTGYFVGTDGRVHVGSPSGTGQAGWGSDQGLMAASGWAPGTESSDPNVFLKSPVAAAPTPVPAQTPDQSSTNQASSNGLPPGAIPTLAAQKQAADIAAQAAGLTGMFNGGLTEAAREFNATNALNAQTAQNKTATDLLTLAASLHSDPFRQLQVMYGANGIDGVNRAVQGLIGQYGLSSGGFTAPGGSSANLGGLVNSYNNAGSGLSPSQQALNTGLTNTNQIIARNYNAAPQNVKDFTTSALSANTGMDQAAVDKQIQNNLPKFTSPDFGLASV